MSKTLSRDQWIYILSAIMALHMFCMPFAVHPQLVDEGPTWLGLDISWQMTLNYANIHDFIWGKDIVYTYGPLGFLATRIGFGVSKWIFILCDLFVIANFFLLFKDFLKLAQDLFLSTLILFCITLLVNTHFGSGLSWFMTVFVYYWMYKTYRDPRTAYFAILVLLIVISFYIKLNSGLFGIVFLAGHLINMLLNRRIKVLKAVLIFGALGVLLLLSGLMLKVDFSGYLTGAMHIIKGYNDVMYLNEHNEYIELRIDILFWSATLLSILYMLFAIKKKMYYQVFFTGITLAYMLLLRKQSVLRNDPQHLSEFLCYLPLVLIYGSFTDDLGKINKTWLAAIFVLVIGDVVFATTVKDPIVAFEARYQGKASYFEQIGAYNNHKNLDQQGKRYIPPTILQKIGNASIDVFPWDSEYIIEHKLNYTPRPVFQSFSAYTDKLQDINYQFYRNKPPQFAIFDYDAIDNRYPFNDEMMVYLHLWKNYRVADTFTSNGRWRLLLQKLPQAGILTVDTVGEETVKIGQEINTAKSVFVKIDMAYTLAGKIQGFWQRPPEVSIEFMRQDGVWMPAYRTSTQLLKAGVFVEKLIVSTKDFYNYVQHNDVLGRVVKIRVSTKYPECFLPDIKVQHFIAY